MRPLLLTFFVSALLSGCVGSDDNSTALRMEGRLPFNGDLIIGQ